MSFILQDILEAKIKELQEENARLRELVERAKPWAWCYRYEGSFCDMEKWLKDAEEKSE